MGSARDLVWMLWRHETSKQSMLASERLFRDSERLAYTELAKKQTDEVQLDGWFIDWLLKDNSGVPKVILICRWWAEENGMLVD